MSPAFNFLHSEHILALLIAILIFFTTILLVVKRWIGFSITLLLLLFALAAGLIVNYQQDLQYYFGFSSPASSESETSPDSFHKHMLQALEDLKLEVSTEKDNLRRVMNQVQEIFESMDMQKQKLQSFIEEASEQFKSEYPAHSSSHSAESTPSSTASEQSSTSTPSS